MSTHRQCCRGIRLWVGTWTTAFLLLSAVELHGPSAVSTLVTSTPVLAESECGDSDEHFDRHEGELSPEHPEARLKKQLLLKWRPTPSIAPLTLTDSVPFVEPAIKGPLLAILLPARAPPTA